MKRFVMFWALSATGMLAAQPCLAADDIVDRQLSARQNGAFVGSTVRLQLGGKAKNRPQARLALGMRTVDRGGVPGSTQLASSSALELGLASSAQPALYIGGQSMSGIKQRMALRDSPFRGTVGLVLTVALVAVGILVLSQDMD